MQSAATACNVNTGALLITLLISGFGWIFFGYYLNKVVKHRYGRREKCCYCVSEDYCNRHKIIPENFNTNDIDDMCGVVVGQDSDNQENIEAVDREIRERDGIKISHLTKSFPPAVKNNPPIVAVADFSVAL